jgi:type IV pilus assembly protein PilW
MLPGSPTCTATALRDVRVFNFSEDFVTVTYYLGFRNDDNPDARRNSPAAKRLIPTLIRRENGVDQELVQGVDRLDFRFGVQDITGNTRFLSADKVENRNGGTVTCPNKPEGVAPNPTVPQQRAWMSVAICSRRRDTSLDEFGQRRARA